MAGPTGAVTTRERAPVLEARKLSVKPPGAAEPAVRDVSLSLGRGEWLAVTGPNGCGKTSLLLGLAGLWPTQGGLRLLGRPFGPDAAPSLRRDLGVILQDPVSQVLQPTVLEEIAFAARNLGVGEPQARRKAERWGRALGISEDLGRDPAALSGGRLQLVLIASALAAAPRVLLADEATAHLDPEARCRALGILKRRAARGLSLVWVTQEPEELRAASRLLEMGEAAPPAGAPPPAAGPAGRPLATLEVAPLGSGEGPRVQTAVRLTIEVPDRGITALVGPNGAGKSVLLEAVAGLEAPPQVRVGWLRAPDPPPVLSLQHPEQQMFEERVADELAYAGAARGAPRGEVLERASGHLEELGFEPRGFLVRRTWSLSSGERRILEVVAALVAPACLVALDEPTAGLDPVRRQRLGAILARAGERRPLLVATQDRAWAAAYGTWIVRVGGSGA